MKERLFRTCCWLCPRHPFSPRSRETSPPQSDLYTQQSELYIQQSDLYLPPPQSDLSLTLQLDQLNQLSTLLHILMCDQPNIPARLTNLNLIQLDPTSANTVVSFLL